MNVFGFPLRIDPFFFVLILILGRSRFDRPETLVILFAVVFVSILVHELGHAFVGKSFGLEPSIALTGTGGLTSWEYASHITPPRQIAISLAGPFAGFLLAALVYTLFHVVKYWPEGWLGEVFYADLININIGWGILNLLPVIPLDGGHVVQSIEEWITGRGNGKVAVGLSVIVAMVVMVWGFSTGQLWLAVMMGFFLVSNGNILFQNNG